MFLLARSALCITLVVAALPESPAAAPGAALFDTIAVDTGGAAAAAVDRFCRREPARCLRAAEVVTTPVSAQPRPARPTAARVSPFRVVGAAFRLL